MEPSNQPSRRTFQRRLETMITRLREEIREGFYKAGDYLPSETDLVDRFQLSNKSVRKGLEQLIAEGLIVKVNRVGSRVTEDAGAAVTVSFGYHASIERDFMLAHLLADFQSLHPKIRVKKVELRASDPASLRDYLQNGLLDALTINNAHFTDLAESGWKHVLEPRAANPGLYTFASEAFVLEGVRYASPVVFSPILLAYNRDHFIEAGVPEPDGSWTWREALRHAAALTVPGKRHGFYFHLLSDNRWPAFLLQSGMRFEPDGEGIFHLAGTRLLESIRLCKAIVTDNDVYPNYLSESNHDVNELFMQGRVSMIMTNYMTLNEIKHADIRYDISPLPYLYEPRSLLNVIGVAVNSQAKEKEAALLLADYFSSPRAQRMIRELTLSLPALKEAAEEPVQPGETLNRPSRYFLFREIMSSFRLHRELNLSKDAFSSLRQLLKHYWSGLIDEDELCERSLQLFNRQEQP
ncbi:extracellular solute-binding protein [Paenibacillus sp. MBLB4367]|uniref:extracellular solute-binding protein n=1 Tax=Paenibacillus sp. MBLB4367 TaxID=3384767 RepID=UPI0039083134